VTDNGVAQVGSSVSCYFCEHNANEATARRHAWGGEQLHCTTCHKNGHRACEQCDACLPRGHRWNRFYCSGSCRVRAHVEREQKALERAAWESENPEAAAQERAEAEERVAGIRRLVALSGFSPEARGREQRECELQAKAECCAECGRPFEPGETLYRRSRRLSRFSPVLAYCEDHRCGQPDDYHNSDLPDGSYYPGCGCDEGSWTTAGPCESCGRLVRNHEHTANPRKFVRYWRTYDEEARRGRLVAEYHRRLDECKTDEEREDVVGLAQEIPPAGLVVHTFCSKNCRRDFYRAAARVKRQNMPPRRCEGCRREFNGRSDSLYCSNACRQRAYRKRKVARA
jgi:hypothetical protein